MSNQGAKQQIVDKIADAEAILVALSKSPSVDELSAALGLTMVLNASKRRTTAIFSGDIPPVLQFLEPEKTFENTVDSLRDFIVAISKDKADNLRMKVEGDKAKIYITPYRTTINEDDLDFSQGEYNVDLVIALGVTERDQLDKALAAHGKIFHDASVVSLSNGAEKSTLGSTDWYDQNASSLSEMIVMLSDELHESEQSVKIDKPIATALLTGIVASTERFSNEKTSPRVMNMASQLMSLGADQQLIATNLQPVIEPEENNSDKFDNDSSSGSSARKRRHRSGSKNSKNAKNTDKKPKDPNEIGRLSISHEKRGDLDEISQQTAEENAAAAHASAEDALDKLASETAEESQSEAAKLAEARLADELDKKIPEASSNTLSVDDIQKDLADAAAESDEAAKSVDADSEPKLPEPKPIEEPAPEPVLRGAVATDQWKTPGEERPTVTPTQPEKLEDTPSIGGTLNATTERAEADKRREEQNGKNKTILSHNKGYVGDSQPTLPPVPINGSMADESKPVNDPSLDTGSGSLQYEPTDRNDRVIEPPKQQSAEPESPVLAQPTEPPALPEPSPAMPEQNTSQTLADIDRLNRVPKQEDAMSAVEAALGEEAYNESASPTLTGDVEAGGEAPLPPPPPMPDFSNMGVTPDFSKLPPPPPMPGTPEVVDIPASPEAVAAAQAPSDPGQFKIPGQ